MTVIVVEDPVAVEKHSRPPAMRRKLAAQPGEIVRRPGIGEPAASDDGLSGHNSNSGSVIAEANFPWSIELAQ